MSDLESTAAAREVAQRVVKAMWAEDRASQAAGMEIAQVGVGYVKLKMPVRDNMVDGHKTAQGGCIFALADSAFAFACSFAGKIPVAARCSITLLRPAKLGDLLVAEAREAACAGRSAIYDVTVSANDRVIAECRGHARVIGGSFLENTGQS